MLSAVRRRMTWANVAMTLALVFAMSGGAYAAKKYLITSTKQISPKVLAQLKGAAAPAGPAGAAGPAGPQGPAGANGKDGTNGANGEPGKEGKAGTNGKSVVTGAATGSECASGGATVEVEGTPASKKHVCNGGEGKVGKEGSPWTAGGKLPSGATETGSWGVDVWVPGRVFVPISFALPVFHIGSISKVTEPGVEAGHAAYVKKGQVGIEHTTECPASPPVSGVFEPKAAPGWLCVYAISEATDITLEGFLKEGTASGPVVRLNATEEKTPKSGESGSFANGAWAVTAE